LQYNIWVGADNFILVMERSAVAAYSAACCIDPDKASKIAKQSYYGNGKETKYYLDENILECINIQCY